MRYVDRGEPVRDYLLADLIQDGGWHDLDLSVDRLGNPLVPPEGASHLVHLKVELVGSVAYEWAELRKKGYTEGEMWCIQHKINEWYSQGGMIMLDADRKIQYKLDTNLTDLRVIVRGWWIG